MTKQPAVWVAAARLLRRTAAAQPEYRLLLKRQRDGAAMSDPFLMEAGIELFAQACPEQPPETWDLLRSTLDEGFRSIDRRLKECGPLQPEQFNLKDADERLSALQRHGRFQL